MKSTVRKLIPESAISTYHLILARFAALVYGYPSEKLIVIGVTGTNGKSTTVNFIGNILEGAGHKVGWTSTASFKVGEREWANDRKMTMLGRFQTQKLLRDMVRAGCHYAIVETSSQGIAQSRHVGINYDVAVFTNLTPEHIEAHGGFENYKKAKGRLFASLTKGKKKIFDGEQVIKTAIANLDDEHAQYFLSFNADRKIGFGTEPVKDEWVGEMGVESLIADGVTTTGEGSYFTLHSTLFNLKPIGLFNVKNALSAIAVGRAVGMSWEEIRQGVADLSSVPGRLEAIEAGQPFSVIVDYAYEPAALTAVYDTLKLLKINRIIHVLGSAGGGRDKARRKILGQMAAEHDDLVIVTNEDPYDEDPQAIIDAVAQGAKAAGKKDGRNLLRILDRQEAINRAILEAKAGDLVLITGKGCEPVMAVGGGKKIPWDDRDAARRALEKLGYHQ